MNGRQACPKCGCAIIKDCTRCKPEKIVLVYADRPEKDDPETWRRIIAKHLESGPRSYRADQYRQDQWVECDSCASKPGSPALCAGCLANRDTFSRLKEMLDGKA